MSKTLWLLSSGLVALATPAFAQQTDVAQEAQPSTAPQPATSAAPTPTEAGAVEAGVDGARDSTAVAEGSDIIVTATRRSQALSDVPLAVSAVTADSLANSGATDIRQLNQLSPSLLVSSTTSEAGAGVARIRGIGTVGDNPGLESSVALFIDGVYRSRTGTGLTELGAIDRIEVLRGPQGTLFGRNASAGLVHVITARPKFENEGTAEFTYGNYDYYRGVLGLTGPITDTLAYRVDGVYVKRDGFLRDIVSGRDVNDRDRWLVRGQLLFEPTDQLSVRIIGDYSDKNEECCGATYIAARDVRSNGNGTFSEGPSSVARAIRSIGGIVPDDTYARDVAISPGRSFRQDVIDWGVSGEVSYDFGGASLTSITAYRDNDYKRGQDTDFNSLDLLYRPDDGRDFIRFRTFSQELRLQGEAFDGKLDWLVGGYYAKERLDVGSALSYGADYDRYIGALVRNSPGVPAPLNLFPGFQNTRGFVTNVLTAQAPQAAAAINGVIAPLIQNVAVSNTGQDDRYRQDSRNYAFFTHNVINFTDTLSLTLGARYTNERKKLRANLSSTVPANAGGVPFTLANGTVTLVPAGLAQSITALTGLVNANNALSPLAAGARQILAGLAGSAVAPLPLVLTPFNGTLPSRTRKESEWTGTAVLGWKPIDTVLAYASFSRGYKAGGFNLDRSVLSLATPDLDQLQFEAEKVDAYEVGVKWNGPGIDINVAAFRQDFDDFQLNNFQGLNFIVENINGCSELAGGSGADSDQSSATGACTGKLEPGVRSEGVEIEAFLRPAPTVGVNLGFTLADTKYKSDLVGAGGRALPNSLLNLPGRRASNSSLYTVTGSFSWTPELGTGGLSGLLYTDFRYQSDINTGSDLFYEKQQDGVLVVNARVGVRGGEGGWGIEFWGQNIFDKDYTQVAFNVPTQGSGDTRSVISGAQPGANRLYGAFLAEPRTYGVTVRTAF